MKQRTAQPVPPMFYSEDLFMGGSPDPLELVCECEDLDEEAGFQSGTSLNDWIRNYKEAH